MHEMLTAVYRQGAFFPEDPCDLPEGARVVLTIHQDLMVQKPEVTEPEERQRILRDLVAAMKLNPVPAGAPPRFTRDEMHERGRH